MSHDRYIQILKHIHLSDSESQFGQNDANFDKFCKVRPMITMIDVKII